MPELPNDFRLRTDFPVGVSLKLREHLHTFFTLEDFGEYAAQSLRETVRAFLVNRQLHACETASDES